MLNGDCKQWFQMLWYIQSSQYAYSPVTSFSNIALQFTRDVVKIMGKILLEKFIPQKWTSLITVAISKSFILASTLFVILSVGLCWKVDS